MPAADCYQQHGAEASQRTKHQPSQQINSWDRQNGSDQRNELETQPVGAEQLENPRHIVEIPVRCAIPARAKGGDVASFQDIERVKRSIGFVYIDAGRNAIEAVCAQEDRQSEDQEKGSNLQPMVPEGVGPKCQRSCGAWRTASNGSNQPGSK